VSLSATRGTPNARWIEATQERFTIAALRSLRERVPHDGRGRDSFPPAPVTSVLFHGHNQDDLSEQDPHLLPDWRHAPTPAIPEALAAVPLTERQQIVVVPDDAIPHDRGSRAVHLRPGNLAYRVKRRLPGRSDEGAPPVLDPRVQSARDLRDDGILMLPVRASDALELAMPVGHPRVGVVYVSDPAESSRYWPAADFHKRVFEHKFAEAARLVMALGAETMRVHSKRGWGGELAIGLLVPIPVLKRQAKLGAAAEREQDILFEARLQPSQLPALPDGLIWYSQEPSWQMVAAGRLTHGLTDFELKVEWTDDYGINAAFQDKVRRKKLLEFGGDFVAHKSTLWTIEGTFAPLPQEDTRGRWRTRR
jgi:hypothetical protein